MRLWKRQGHVPRPRKKKKAEIDRVDFETREWEREEAKAIVRDKSNDV